MVLRRGVYADKELLHSLGTGPYHGVEAAAAILALRAEDVVASHRSAAVLHGLDLLSEPGGVTVTRPPGKGSHGDQPGVHVHRADLPKRHLSRRSGVMVTSPARTVVDLARTLPADR